MKIKGLNERPAIGDNKKLKARFLLFEKVLDELNKKEIPDEIVGAINSQIDEVNAATDEEKGLKTKLKKSQNIILKLVEKELKFVTINHYRNLYLGVGLALGVAFGSAFGASLGNMAFMGVGLPIGMAIGIAIGTQKDKEAKESGKQLDLEIK
ncbi:hypothetical protein [Fulvivirga lutimaris]|uniref:hypothetical protein n=1 Tax=Fulvivirga lutimaris TaxID=1819566 RepID=UPI0012BC507E|nr:hypothetical protein [Fulvivirga lutimaris]MTI39017.1 hypothetical protein [Fulvivirga lutimaris]